MLSTPAAAGRAECTPAKYFLRLALTALRGMIYVTKQLAIDINNTTWMEIT
jgi:hypothetical protein